MTSKEWQKYLIEHQTYLVKHWGAIEDDRVQELISDLATCETARGGYAKDAYECLARAEATERELAECKEVRHDLQRQIESCVNHKLHEENGALRQQRDRLVETLLECKRGVYGTEVLSTAQLVIGNIVDAALRAVEGEKR